MLLNPLKWISFLLLASCSTSPWTVNTLKESQMRYNSVSLSYVPSNPYKDPKLEFILSNEGLSLYLIYPFAQLSGETVPLTLENPPFQSKGYILKGGQKIKVEDSLAEAILRALNEQSEVTLWIADAAILLNKEGFIKAQKEALSYKLFDPNKN